MDGSVLGQLTPLLIFWSVNTSTQVIQERGLTSHGRLGFSSVNTYTQVIQERGLTSHGRLSSWSVNTSTRVIQERGLTYTDGLLSRQLSPDLQVTQKKGLILRMRGVFPCRVLTRDCVMLITSWWLQRCACRAADDGEDGITRLNGPLALTITAYELRNSLPCRIRMAWLFTKSRQALPMAWFLTRAQQRCRVMETGWCCSCGRYN